MIGHDARAVVGGDLVEDLLGDLAALQLVLHSADGARGVSRELRRVAAEASPLHVGRHAQLDVSGARRPGALNDQRPLEMIVHLNNTHDNLRPFKGY